MDWSNDITVGLPAPRDDEPESLRDDIAHELKDHLACAFTAESRNTEDEAAALDAVLERFGDPVRIGRQLWFDAMREKIMTQRILLGTVVLTAVVSISATVLGWVSAREARSAAETLLAESRAADEKLLEQTRTENESLRDAVASLTRQYARVKVRLVYNDVDQTPVESLRPVLSGGSPEGVYSSKVDSSGLADFGLLPAGRYELRVRFPDADSVTFGGSGERFEKQFRAESGEEYEFEVVCPSKRPAESVLVSFNVDWPQDLREKDLLVFAAVENVGRDVAGAHWELPIGVPAVCIKPDGFVTLSSRVVAGEFRLGMSGFDPRFARRRAGAAEAPRRAPTFALTAGAVDWTSRSSMKLPEENYRLTQIVVTRAEAVGESERTLRQGSELPLLSEKVRAFPVVVATSGDWSERRQRSRLPTTKYEAPLEPEQKFTAAPGRPNQWTIKLTDEFWNRVREALESDDGQNPKE